MLMRMCPDHPEYARERKWLTRMVVVGLVVATTTLLAQIAPRVM
jgi:hypothetical protein